MQETAIYKAGSIEIFPAARELRRAGRPVKMQRRAFDLLVYLVENRDRAVDKDELWREVWESRPVSDSVIPRAISKVRKALGSEDEDEWITTLHGVGYRFVHPLEVAERGEALPQPLKALPLMRRKWLVAAMILVVLSAGAAYLWLARDAPPSRVAVLPVQIEGTSQPLDWVQYGVLPLIDQALADDGVPSISSGTVLATLRRHPQVADIAEQARILRLNTGAERVLLPRLTMQGGQYLLTVTAVDEGQPMSVSVVGTDPVLMAVGAGTRLSEASGWRRDALRPFRKVVTDDPFVNEAYARGLDARLRSEWQSAVDFFETVLNAAPDLHWAKYQLTLATRRLGQWARTEKLNQELLAAAKETGDRELEGSVQTTSGTLAWRRGHLDEAGRWYRLAEKTFMEIGSRHSIASVYGNLAILASLRGQFDEAESLYRQALDRYLELGDLYNASAVRKNFGLMYLDRGLLGQATAQIERSLETRQQLGLKREAALNLSSLADIEVRLGRWDSSLAMHQRVLQVARETDDPVFEAQALTDQCNVHRLAGRLSEGRERCNEALFVARQLGHRSVEAYALFYLALLEQRADAPDRARVLAEEAYQIYRDLDYSQGLASASQLLFELEPDPGSETARERLELARSHLDEADNELQRVKWHLLAAIHYDAAGDPGGAERHWLKALSDAGALNNPYELLQVQWQYAERELARGTAHSGLDTLITAIEGNEIKLPESERLIARFRAAAGDSQRAALAAQRWKELAGEAWTPEDQAELERLSQ